MAWAEHWTRTIATATWQAGDPTATVRPAAAVGTGAAAGAPPPAGLELLAPLGAGGTAAVYRARQRSLGRMVAAKRPHGGAEDAQAFLAEARIAADLDHPNIVAVHELYHDEAGAPLLAMRLAEGRSWAELLREDPPLLRADDGAALRWDDAAAERHLRILGQVAQAVAFAHQRGIVHRDLKPANVLIGSFGEVLLTDWGLAAHWRGLPAAPPPCGTPAYLAPEQADPAHGAQGPWTDIYLLGATLHHALCGRPPHGRKSIAATVAVAAGHGGDDRPPLPAAVPADLAAIARTAMAADPAARFADATAFADALTAHLRHRDAARLETAARARLAAGGTADLAAALAGFEQAQVLWPDSPQARTGLAETRLAWAGAALRAGDLALCAAQLAALPADDGRAAALRAALAVRHRQADGQRRRTALLARGLLAAGVVIALGLAGGATVYRGAALRAEASAAAARTAAAQSFYERGQALAGDTRYELATACSLRAVELAPPTAGGDGADWAWRAARHQLLQVPRPFPVAPLRRGPLALAADESFVLGCDAHGPLRWDARHGRELDRLPWDGAPPTDLLLDEQASLAVIGDGRRLAVVELAAPPDAAPATAGARGLVRRHLAAGGPGRPLALSSVLGLLVVAVDGAVEGRDLGSGAVRWRQALAGPPLAAAISDAAHGLVLVAGGTHLLALAAADGRPAWTREFAQPITALAVGTSDARGWLAAVAARDQLGHPVVLLDAAGATVGRLAGHEAPIDCVVFSTLIPDYLVTSGQGGVVRTWDLGILQMAHQIDLPAGTVDHMTLGADTGRATAWTADGRLRVWGYSYTQSEREAQRLPALPAAGAASGLAAGADGSFVAWDGTQASAGPLDGAPPRALGVAALAGGVAADGWWLLTGDGQVRRAAGGAHQACPPCTVAFTSPRGGRALAGQAAGDGWTWTVVDPLHPGGARQWSGPGLRAAALADDGSRVLLLTAAGTCELRDGAGALLARPPVSGGRAVAIEPDGSLAAVIDGDGTIAVLDGADGRLRRRVGLGWGEQGAERLVLVGDHASAVVVTGGDPLRRLRLVDLETGRQHGRMETPLPWIDALAVAPSGDEVLFTVGDRLWRWPIADPAAPLAMPSDLAPLYTLLGLRVATDGPQAGEVVALVP